MKDYTIAFSSILTENYIPLDSMDSSPAHVVLATCAVLAKRLMCMVFHKECYFLNTSGYFCTKNLRIFHQLSFSMETDGIVETKRIC